MPTILKFRRGTTSQHSSFTGAVGEITVDTDKDCAVVHDGSTSGGFPVMRADVSNVTNPQFGGALALKLPDGSTAQRPGSPVNGQIRYNNSDGIIEAYSSNGWHYIGAVGRMWKATKTNLQAINSYNFTDVSGLSVTVAPASSTSKFLIIADLKASTVQNGEWGGGHMAILRNGTKIHYYDSSASNKDSSHGGLQHNQHHMAYRYRANFVDSPGTTSSITYKIQFAVTNYGGANSYINRAYHESTTYSGTGGSGLTVFEVLD